MNLLNHLLFLFPERIALKGHVRFIETDINTGEVTVSAWKNNLIVTAGKVAILRRLGNRAVNANEGMITYGAVGTGTATPVVGDTTLGTELARKAVSTTTVVGSVLTIRVFFDSSEANGTWTEFGWFGEAATGAADSGTMFNHLQISKVKASTKTVTVEQEITYY